MNIALLTKDYNVRTADAGFTTVLSFAKELKRQEEHHKIKKWLFCTSDADYEDIRKFEPKSNTINQANQFANILNQMRQEPKLKEIKDKSKELKQQIKENTMTKLINDLI